MRSPFSLSRIVQYQLQAVLLWLCPKKDKGYILWWKKKSLMWTCFLLWQSWYVCKDQTADTVERWYQSLCVDWDSCWKIRKQAEFLEELGKSNEAEMLHGYIEELEVGDVTNREGHAAKVYFNALFGKDFTRSRDCIINAALNYGYSLILFV